MKHCIRKLLRLELAVLLILSLTAVCAQAEWNDAGEENPGWNDFGVEGSEWDGGLGENVVLNMDADLLIAYVGSGAESINPYNCTNRDLIGLMDLSFESLVQLDDNLQPTPLLAENWTHDGKTWKFTLRSGIVFHNGDTLSAYDVVACYERIMSIGSSSPYYTRLGAIKSMEATDALEVTVTSNYTGYITLYAMTFPIVETSTINDTMARGTGPYWITQYSAGQGVRLERNPLWWKYDPNVETMTLVQFSETGDALEALHTGEINVLCSQSSTIAYSKKLSKFTSMDYLTNVYEMLVPNLSDDSVMGDVRMRQAVMYAIDGAAIAANAFGGMGIQCEVPVNPGSWLYESQSAMYYYSPERALQLVLDCGWQDLTGDGKMNKVNGVILEDLTIKIVTYNDTTNSMHENAVNMIATYLGNIGFNVEIEVCDSADRVKTRMKNHNYDLALVAVNLSDTPTVASVLGKGGSLNFNNYSNATMNDLLDQTASADETGLKSLYSRIQLQVVETLPILGLMFRTGTVLSTRSLGGLSGLRASSVLHGIEYMPK